MLMLGKRFPRISGYLARPATGAVSTSREQKQRKTNSGTCISMISTMIGLLSNLC